MKNLDFKGSQGDWIVGEQILDSVGVYCKGSMFSSFIDVWCLGNITEEEMKANANIVGQKNAQKAILKAFDSSEDKLSIKLRKHGKLDFYTK